MAKSAIFALLFGFGLLLASPAEAQFIDCSAPLGPCSEDIYGLGNDNTEGPFTNSRNHNRTSQGDGSCGGENFGNYQGQIRIREQDNCIVTGANRCTVEIPQIPLDSGYTSVNRADIDLGPAGILAVSASAFTPVDGNIGFRQLHGTCVNDAGEECGLDSDCPGGEAGDCQSTCFSDPATQCTSQADCPNADCITEIEWDGIGTCSDDASGPCLSDGDCSGGEVCEAGFEIHPGVDQNCICCQSTLTTFCPLLGLPEYPVIGCGEGLSGLLVESNFIDTPDWVFDGGRETAWAMEEILVPNMQEGLCDGNRTLDSRGHMARSRPCGAQGDIRAGGINGKCQDLFCTLDSNEACTEDADCPSNAGCAGTCQTDPFDPENPALPSACDDVAFGGIAGDFCSLVEDGFRESVGDTLADGRANPNRCPNSWSHFAGTPNRLCAIPNAVPIGAGDPQPGCRLFNYGVDLKWDLDCNGVPDTDQGRCAPVVTEPPEPNTRLEVRCGDDPANCPLCTVDADCPSGACINNGDLCPGLNEINQLLDTNADGVGDECQCGDQNGDGAITSTDIGGTALCANAAAPFEVCDTTIVDATGDNATTAEDIAGVVAVVNGAVGPSDLGCVRNP